MITGFFQQYKYLKSKNFSTKDSLLFSIHQVQIDFYSGCRKLKRKFRSLFK